MCKILTGFEYLAAATAGVSDLVEVVQYRHTGLVPPSLPLLPVVRLAGGEPPRPAPGAVRTAGRGSHPQPGGGPVPTVLYRGLEILPFTP